MENKQVKKEFITRLKGEYQAKYGFEMDDWTSIILYEVSEQFNGFFKIIEESKQTIHAATEQIKGQVTPIYFNDRKEAFMYGLARTLGVAGPLSLAACFIASLIFWVQTTSIAYQDKVQFVNNYENIEDFRLFASESKVITEGGERYLVLKPRQKKAGDILIGKEYMYKSNLEEVWVPLGR